LEKKGGTRLKPEGGEKIGSQMREREAQSGKGGGKEGRKKGTSVERQGTRKRRKGG